MKLNIKDRVDKLGTSKTKLAQQLDISYPTMLDMYNGESTSIKFETLEKLCNILQCSPNDILMYEPTKEIRSSSKDNVILHLSDLHFSTPTSDDDFAKSQLQLLLDTLKIEISDGADGRKRGYIFLDGFDEITPEDFAKLQNTKLPTTQLLLTSREDTNKKDDTK